MVFKCSLCEEEYCIIYSLCESCRTIKHLMTVYTRERVYEILNNVLKRDESKQNNKIVLEKQNELKTLQDSLDEYPNKKNLMKELKDKIKKR